MNTNFEKEYIERCNSLVLSLRIKFSAFAVLLNEEIINKHGKDAVDMSDPSTWVYYKHLAGEYHELYDPVHMEVISLDTQELIDFTKENLNIHTATKKAYTLGTRYYYSLIQRYPDKEELILGILFPCDKEEAINAREYKVLNYDKTLVEDQEYRLIDDIQKYIDGHASRWFVNAFKYTNSYYVLAYYVTCYTAIYQKLFAIRLDQAKTPYAHSFYIKEYLKSNSGLDKYIPYMTTKQLMFIYRNLKRFQLHSGKVERFEVLLEKLLTDRNIPLSEFSVRQTSNFDNQLYPEITVKSRPLNPETNERLNNYYTLEELFKIEQKTLPTNIKFHESQGHVIEKKLQNSPSSVMQTKALYSAMVDYTTDSYMSLDRLLLDQWIHLVNLQYTDSNFKTKYFYSAYVSFKLPGVADLKTISARDALIYFQYLVNSELGIETPEKFELLVIKQRKLRVPSYSYLTEHTNVRNNPILKHYTNDAIAGHPQYPLQLTGVYGINSVELFNEKGVELFEELKRESFVLGLMDSVTTKGELEHIYSRFFEQKLYEMSLPVGQDFPTWLRINTLPASFNIPSDRTKLIKDIFQAATGYYVDETKTLKNIQSAMVSMMKQLTSYSIEYHRDINEESLIPVLTSYPGVDITKYVRKLELEIGANYDVISLDRKRELTYYGSAEEEQVEFNLSDKTLVFELPLWQFAGFDGGSVIGYDIELDDIVLDFNEYRVTDNVTGLVNVYDAQTYYDRLSPVIKQSILNKFMSE